MKSLLKLTLILTILINSTFVFSQKINELGIMLGGTYYQGDINTSKLFQSPFVAGGILFRHNFSTRYALRVNAIIGKLKGNDSKSNFSYQQTGLRNRDFDYMFIDISAQVEFNFIDYIPNDPNYKYTPYVSLGGTFVYASGNSNSPFQPAIPFGIGIKYSLSEKISTGIEWTYRKTFSDSFDKLEGVDDVGITKQVAYNHDNDWYSYAGIYIAFRFYTKKLGKCPAYGGYYKH